MISPQSARHPSRSIRRGVAAATLMALFAMPAARAQVAESVPLPGPPRPLAIGTPVEQRLPNGMRVVLAERRGVGVVTAELVVLAGSETDPPQRAGLAALTASLLTKGTKAHSASALARAAESLGGSLDSGASWHQSEVAITVTTPALDPALGLLAETVQQPALAQTELDRLRVQTLDELKVAYTRPGTLASIAVQHLLFGNGAYGHPAGGTPASLQRITRADLLAMHAQHYRPDNAVLVLAGDIDAATALQLARRHFGTWKPAPGAAPPPLATTPGDALPQTEVVIDMPQSGQAAVLLATPLPPLGADRAAAAVMNAVLGGGYSSRLNQEIRIKRGLSYGAGSQLDSRRTGASLRLVVQTKNESAAEVAALMNAELDRLIAAPVDEAELAARKATLIGDFSRSVETTAGLSAAVRSLIVAGLPPADLRTRIEVLGTVGTADVQRYAAAHLAPSQRRLVIAGEAAAFGTALRAVAPGAVTVEAGALDVERGDGLKAP